MLDRIPDGSRVAASDTLGARIALRTDLYLIGDTYRRSTDRRCRPRTSTTWSGSPSTARSLPAPVPAWRGFARLIDSGEFEVVAEADGVIVARRVAALPWRVASPRMDDPTCRACLVYDESLTSYDFGPTHPMNPIRVDLTVALAGALGVLDTLPRSPRPTPPRTTSPPCTSPA